MEEVVNRAFRNERVVWDRPQRFVDCVFDGCVIVFTGAPTHIKGCDITNCTWEFAGPAEATVAMLAALWPAGNDGFVRQVLSTITGDGEGVDALMARRQPRRQPGPSRDL